MNQPVVIEGMVIMPQAEFDQLIERLIERASEKASERAAIAALASVGLEGPGAAEDIRALRHLLDAYNSAKRTAWQTIIKMLTTGFVLALLAGALIKLKVFGAAS